jgi:hypothetical protein
MKATSRAMPARRSGTIDFMEKVARTNSPIQRVRLINGAKEIKSIDCLGYL